MSHAKVVGGAALTPRGMADEGIRPTVAASPGPEGPFGSFV